MLQQIVTVKVLSTGRVGHPNRAPVDASEVWGTQKSQRSVTACVKVPRDSSSPSPGNPPALGGLGKWGVSALRAAAEMARKRPSASGLEGKVSRAGSHYLITLPELGWRETRYLH